MGREHPKLAELLFELRRAETLAPIRFRKVMSMGVDKLKPEILVFYYDKSYVINLGQPIPGTNIYPLVSKKDGKAN